MGIIARNEKQLTLIFSSNTRVGKHTYSYLTGIDQKYLAIDLAKSKVGDTMWVEIAEALGVKVGDLVDKRELDIDSKATEDFGTHDWLKIIQINDFVISRPIVIMGEITRQIDNPTEILEFFGVDSTGLQQSPTDEKGLNNEKTSGGENFIEKNN